MIKTNTIIDAGRRIIRHYSDAGYQIRQVETGVLYDEARDLEPCEYTYEETSLPIEEPDLTDSEALAAIVGGDLS